MRSASRSTVTVRVSTVVPAAPEAVWRRLRDIARHVEWMQDAVEIEFEGRQREGVGARFVCVTRVGPIRLADRMEVTEWIENEAIRVRHSGVVAGVGEFRLTPLPSSAGHGVRTGFSWTESLSFPVWLGGRLGAVLARPALRRIWRRNLSVFSQQWAEGA